MTSNLQEFLAIATLVTSSTFLVVGFRYMITIWETSAKEEVRRRQTEWEVIAAKRSQKE